MRAKGGANRKGAGTKGSAGARMADASRCHWVAGVIGGEASVLNRCDQAGLYMVSKDGLEVGRVCELHYWSAKLGAMDVDAVPRRAPRVERRERTVSLC